MNKNYIKIKSAAVLSFFMTVFLITAGCQQNSNENISESFKNENIALNSIEPVSTFSANYDSNAKNSTTDFEKKLASEGYDIEEIESVDLYAKRVLLQLNEINTFSQSLGLQNTIDIDPFKSQTDDNSIYSELLSKLDEKESVYYVVKLKKDFDTTEEAFDEYLASVQLDIDISEYFSNKDTYKRIKTEKLSSIAYTELIDTKQIERKSLENLQKLNDANKSSFDGINPLPGNPSNNSIPDIYNPQPGLPKVDIPRPVDPAEEIRKKIESPY